MSAITFPNSGSGLKYTLGNRMFKLVMRTAHAARMTGCELGEGRLPTRDEIKAALSGNTRGIVNVTWD